MPEQAKFGAYIQEDDFYFSYSFEIKNAEISVDSVQALKKKIAHAEDSLVVYLPKLNRYLKVSVSDYNIVYGLEEVQFYWAFWVGKRSILKKFSAAITVETWIETPSGIIRKKALDLDKAALLNSK